MLNDAATILPVFSELMRDIVSFRGLGSGGGGYALCGSEAAVNQCSNMFWRAHQECERLCQTKGGLFL